MLKIACLFLSLLMSTSVWAKNRVHQVEASFNFDQREFDPDDSAGNYELDIFQIQAKYRNQFKRRFFLVGEIDFQQGDSSLESIIFTGAGEYNLIESASSNLEAGGGFGVRLFTGDVSGFGIKPYGFLRSFITSSFFISSQISYDWAIVDWNDADGDFTGIHLSAGFGYAF